MSIIPGRGTEERRAWIETSDFGVNSEHDATTRRAIFEAWQAEQPARRAERDAFNAEVVRDFEGGFDPRGCYVYVLWDQSGEPIYVGQSTNVLSRVGSHMSPGRKGPDVARVSFIRCASKESMCALERHMIFLLNPRLNIALNEHKREEEWERRQTQP